MDQQTVYDFLQQDTITLPVGSYLVANTEGDGYTGVHTGRHLYEVQADGASGKKVVPIVTSEDGMELTALTNQPVAKSSTGQVIFMTNTRNDIYQEAHTNIIEVEEGTEDKELIVGFVEFIKDEFAIATWQMMITGPEVFTEEVEPEPEPDPEG